MKHIRLKKSCDITLILISSDYKFIEPKNYTVTYSLFTQVESESESEAGAKAQNKAYQKINYLLEDVINYSVAYDFGIKDHIDKFFADWENNFLTLPVVSEVCFLETLHSKLNVIAGETTFVDSIELTDTKTKTKVLYIDDEVPAEYNLPEQKDFAGDKAFFETPWWTRYDTTTFDNYAEDEESLKEWHENIKTEEFDRMTVIVLEDIDSEIDTQFDSSDKKGELIELEEFKAEIKKREKWKPRLV